MSEKSKKRGKYGHEICEVCGRELPNNVRPCLLCERDNEPGLICEICGFDNGKDHSYDDVTCKRCGQEYIYNEGTSIKLSEGQLETLRANPSLQLI